MAKRGTPTTDGNGSGKYVRSAYSMSPASEYYIYGRGKEEDLSREVSRVKSELRQMVYGKSYEKQDKPQKKEQQKINVGISVISIAMLISALILLLSRIPGLDMLFIVKGSDSLNLIAELFSGDGTALTMGMGILTAVILLLSAAGVIGGAVALRTTGAGNVMRIGLLILLLAEIAIAVIDLIVEKTMPIGLIILLSLAIISMLTACIDRKKRR